MNLILINLRQYNHNKLKDIATKFDWNLDALILFKDNDIANIWVDIDTKEVVAYNIKKDSTIKIGDEFAEKLSQMESYQMPKKNIITNFFIL